MWQPGDTLRLRVPGARPDCAIEVRPRAAEHAILGVCDVAAVPGGPALTRFQAVDWHAPRAIPAMERPAALPSGAGSAILNYLAQRALERGTGPLRYVGPYPTNALFDTLLTCFRVGEPVAEARARFSAQVEELAVAATVREIAVDFWPDPFSRVWNDAKDETGVCGAERAGRSVCVQLRRGVEAVYVGDRAYRRAPSVASPRRVIAPEAPAEDGASWRAVIEIGGRLWAEVARVDGSGRLLDGPHPLPAVTNPLVGTPLPAGIRQVLLAALPARAPQLLQAMLAQVVAEIPIYWADTGDALARYREDRVEVHAALPEAFAEESASALLDTLARALEPVLQRIAQARVERVLTRLLPDI